jgi:hypothetical protein
LIEMPATIAAYPRHTIGPGPNPDARKEAGILWEGCFEPERPYKASPIPAADPEEKRK